MDDRLSCDSLWNLLSAYADGDVTDDEAQLVEHHVASCGECSRALDFLRAVDLDLDINDVPAPPNDLHRRILDATVNRETSRAKRPWWAIPSSARPALASACLVALVGLVWGGGLNGTPHLPWIPPPHMPARQPQGAALASRRLLPQIEPLRDHEPPVLRGYLPSRSMSLPRTTLAVAPTAQSRWTSVDRAHPVTMQSAPALEEPTRAAAEYAPAHMQPAAVPDLRPAPDPAPASKPILASRSTSADEISAVVQPAVMTGTTMRLVSGEAKMGTDMMVSLAGLRRGLDAQDGVEVQKTRIPDVVRPDRREVKVELSLGRF